jgi:hypothetical protein
MRRTFNPCSTRLELAVSKEQDSEAFRFRGAGMTEAFGAWACVRDPPMRTEEIISKETGVELAGGGFDGFATGRC